MSDDRPDMRVRSIEGDRWGELGKTMTPAQRDAAVDALIAALDQQRTVPPERASAPIFRHCRHCPDKQCSGHPKACHSCHGWQDGCQPITGTWDDLPLCPCGEPIIIDGQEFHCDNMATDSQDGLVWRCWWCHRREQERSILTDLIEELRSPGMDAYRARIEADHAEARLREATGDE